MQTVQNEYKVLIIDDDRSLGQVLSGVLSHKGFDARTATCGSEVMGQLDNSIDLIIADVMMPLVSGIEILQRVHELELDTKVIILTGCHDFKTRTRAMRFGVWAYLQKPLGSMENFVIAARSAAQVAYENRRNRQHARQLIEHRERALSHTIAGSSLSKDFLLRQVLEHSPSGILMLTNTGQVTFANLQAASILRLPYTCLIHSEFSTLLNEEYRFEFHQRLDEIRQGILPRRFRFENKGEVARQAIVSVSFSASYEQGELVGILLFIEDITSMLHLNRKAEQFAGMIDQARYDMVLVADINGDIQECNAAAVKTLGWNYEELLNMNLTHLFSSMEESFTDFFSNTEVAFDYSWRGEMAGLKRSGTELPVEVSFTYHHNGKRSGSCLIFAHDISRRQKSQQEIRRAYNEVQKKNMELMNLSQSKNRFVARVTHELRTPLNSIIGFAEILKRNQRQVLQDKEIDFLQRIENNGQRLLKMVNNLLNTARIEEGSYELHTRSFNLSLLLKNLVQDLRSLAAKNNLQINVETSETLRIISDPDILSEILINLIGNAVKFSRDGTIWIHCVVVGDCIEMTVTDCGPGIPKEIQDKIFEPFFQADDTATREHEGSGLGLSICRDLSLLLGGHIALVETETSGASFRLTLPLIPDGDIKHA